MPHEQCKILALPKISDPRGNLTFVESGVHIPFAIQRVYYLYDVPGGAERGGHAHRNLHQFIIAMSGSFDVILDDGVHKQRMHLNRSYRGLYIAPMMWRELDNFSSGSVCLVLASAHYDESDYVRDYATYLKEVEGRGMIPFLDVGAGYRELREELDEAYHRVMDAGVFILGREMEAFEEEFAAYCGVDYCIAVSNGLDALHLTLRAVGIGPGDEVIVPGNTFIATWLAVTSAGGIPVPVDPLPDTFNIDPARVARAITPRTRAIIPVHLYGQPADMDALRGVARQYGLCVVEDAAQAHGARLKGRRVGGLADAACFSFYPAKNLGAFGDGGAITTSDSDLARRLRLLRNYGAEVKYHHEMPGFNCRLDELQAAFLRVKLRHLDVWNARRGRLAALYYRELRDVPNLQLPVVQDVTEPVWHLYAIRHAHRDALEQHLTRQQVRVQIHYPCPPHLTPAYARGPGRRYHLPLTERIASQILSLPIGPHLSDEEVARVAGLVRGLPSMAQAAA